MTSLSFRASIVLLALALASGRLAASTDIPLENPGFESGFDHWVLPPTEAVAAMSKADPAAAHEGTTGLRVTDESPTDGSYLRSQPVPVQPGRTYRVTFWARTQDTGKAGVALWFYDAHAAILKGENQKDPPVVSVKNGDGDWHQYTIKGVAPPDATKLSIWIHSYSTATGTFDFDDFTLAEE